MSDYEPDFVYMIPLNYKKREIYYETISTVPARIRGAFLIDEEKNHYIDFKIESPSKKIVYSNTTHQAIFDFNATEMGSYQIVFDNKYLNSEIRVTFTMNSGQNPILKKDDLTFMDTKVNTVLDFVKKYELEFKLKRNIMHQRYQSTYKHNLIKFIFLLY